MRSRCTDETTWQRGEKRFETIVAYQRADAELRNSITAKIINIPRR